MALTNAEKQKRWRDRRNALAKAAESSPLIGLDRKTLKRKLRPLFNELRKIGAGTIAARVNAVLVEHGVVDR